MRFKYYLKGLGIGIIFATVILMFSGTLHKNLSDEEIIKKAMELGMIMPEKTDSEEGLFGKNTQNSEKPDGEIYTELDSVTQEPATSETDTSEPGTQEPTTQEPSTQVPPVHEEIQQVVFIVYPNDMPRQVSARLEELGLIDSATAFRQYLADNNYSRFIRQGEYVITVGDSYEKIAKMITGRWPE